VSGLCDGRVAVVTGGGRGLGRAYCLALAKAGAKVVVNDLGVGLEGPASSSRATDSGIGGSVAQAVVDEIVLSGGTAVADLNDVSDFEGASRIVANALESFGTLDVVVNNAGVLRDRVLVNLSEEDWDLVVRVHLGGTFAVSHFASRFWRERSKDGHPVDARLINVTSGAGLYGNPGQANYSAAKAGIVGFTLTAALELERYGVTVNALAPGGRTRMTEHVFADAMAPVPEGWDQFDPDNAAPALVWLASERSRGVTGQVIEAWGGRIALVQGWRPVRVADADHRRDPVEVGEIVRRFLEEARRSEGNDDPPAAP
jgi:NAD(P)-dependent dehydrogenase (short-subunit alcohol dehydrogenase family)